MTHETTNVAMVKGRAEQLRESICGVHNARDTGEKNFPVCFPFLEGKMLDVDVTSSWCRETSVNHEDSRGVVLK